LDILLVHEQGYPAENNLCFFLKSIREPGFENFACFLSLAEGLSQLLVQTDDFA